MFNPHARWDRPRPQDKENKFQPVTVVAGFKPAGGILQENKIRPFYFIRHRETVKIDRINYSWCEKKGRVRRHYFSVSVGENVFYLRLDSATMSWNFIEN